jgi:hypothetical protein
MRLGTTAHLFAQPHRREELRRCFEDVLACGRVATVEHPALDLPMLLVRFAGGGRGPCSVCRALERDQVRLGLARRSELPDRDERRPPIGVELVLEVDDLHADHDRVASAGWALEEDLTVRPWGLRDFRLLDPAGYYWRLTTRSSPQP